MEVTLDQSHQEKRGQSGCPINAAELHSCIVINKGLTMNVILLRFENSGQLHCCHFTGRLCALNDASQSGLQMKMHMPLPLRWDLLLQRKKTCRAWCRYVGDSDTT